MLLFSLSVAHRCTGQSTEQRDVGALGLTLKTQMVNGSKISHGRFVVYENRRAKSGRKLELDLVILRAQGDSPRPDPIFYLVGGPGQGAANLWKHISGSWMHKNRDIVLLNQRGTGGSNRLLLPSQRADGLQDILKPLMRKERMNEAIVELGRKADLRMYSTPDAMDDLNDLRIALGYKKINLVGGSYGTRAALVYIRRHEESVRTAVLNGVAPIEFTNPLYHAQSAQLTLEKIFTRVESNAKWREAFPGLRKKFTDVLRRFDSGPIPVTLTIEGTREPVTLKLDKEAFISAIRFQMYSMDTSRRLPAILMQAWAGDFEPLVSSAINRNRALSNSLALGMLMCVTAAEDIDRISPADIDRLTRNTFMGSSRVLRQIENCRNWPRSRLPKNYGDSVRSNVPALILSGTIDPVTPPRWGKLCADNFPNSLHIVAPAAHGVSGPCIDSIIGDFLEAGRVDNLDTSCVDRLELPPFELPAKELSRRESRK